MGKFDRVTAFAKEFERILFIMEVLRHSGLKGNSDKFFIPGVKTLEFDESTIDFFINDLANYKKILCYSVYFDCYYSKLQGRLQNLKRDKEFSI